jgi:hypothetical protein
MTPMCRALSSPSTAQRSANAAGNSSGKRAVLTVVSISSRGRPIAAHPRARTSSLRLEDDGLITRRRDPQNRRVHVVELTPDGEAAFHRMRSAAVEFDRRLRGDLPDDELERVAAILDRLRANVTAG